MSRCRHERNSWLISRGRSLWMEWCYRCGAIRNLKEHGDLSLDPITEWTRPVGPGGKNPCDMKPRKESTR